MSFLQINTLSDIPVEDAKLLGHNEITTTLVNFLSSKNVIGPLTIAIHGDWGSGKTSIMKTVIRNLQNSRIKPLFFEAWKHEYSDPSLALVEHVISGSARIKGKTVAKGIVKLLAEVLAQQTIGMKAQEIEDLFRARTIAVETITDKFEAAIKSGIGKKKLVVFIDDLDRCSVENSLKILSIIKLFLNVQNCIFVAAVDFKRLEQAWILKYGTYEKNTKDARSYLEKIFQIRIGIPHPNSEQVKEYIQTLVPKMPSYLLDLVSKIGPTNPRNIKRMLNLILYRNSLLGSDEPAEVVAVLGTIFEEILSNYGAAIFIKAIGNARNVIDLVVQHGDQWDSIKERFNFKQESILKYNPNVMEDAKVFFDSAQKIFKNLKKTEEELVPYFDNMIKASNEAIRLDLK